MGWKVGVGSFEGGEETKRLAFPFIIIKNIFLIFKKRIFK